MDAQAATPDVRAHRAARLAGALLLALLAADVRGATGDGDLTRGLSLFAQQCAGCHGVEGRGDGPAAPLLDPAPRDLVAGRHRLVSTADGTATDLDLAATLRRGMPGSAMPAWGHLGADDVLALVAALRHLSEQTHADEPRAAGGPGEARPLPPRPPDELLDRAAAHGMYVERCARCHGDDGRGAALDDLRDEAGRPTSARDFRRGIFKGGSAPEDLARRILLGMPGTPMPATECSDVELWSLVAYVSDMVAPGAQDALLQERVTLRAARIANVAGLGPESPLWSRVAATRLALMPLRWRDDFVEGFDVRAVHDGRRLALSLSWIDATVDDDPHHPGAAVDAVAVALSGESDPPFFGMGAAGDPVELWSWRASGPPDPVAPTPRGAHDARAVAAPTCRDAIAALAADGLSVSDDPALAAALRARGRPMGGGWRVVLERELHGAGSTAPLGPGDAVSVAFAVWDGRHGDRGAQKAVTIWHRLELVP